MLLKVPLKAFLYWQTFILPWFTASKSHVGLTFDISSHLTACDFSSQSKTFFLTYSIKPFIVPSVKYFDFQQSLS